MTLDESLLPFLSTDPELVSLINFFLNSEWRVIFSVCMSVFRSFYPFSHFLFLMYKGTDDYFYCNFF